MGSLLLCRYATGPKTRAQRDLAALLNSGAMHLLRGLRAVDRLSDMTPALSSALSVEVFGSTVRGSVLGAMRLSSPRGVPEDNFDPAIDMVFRKLDTNLVS